MQSVLGRQSTLGSESVPSSLVQEHLEKMLASPGFANSERHGRLLRHLVSTTLAGRGGEIKEYVLAVEVFGRGESFDPQTDAIVRTEVSRLRGRLKAYYSAEGRDDNVIVDLPVRSYLPVFRFREPPPPVEAPETRTRRRWRWVGVLAGLAMAATLLMYGSFWRASASRTGAGTGPAAESLSVAVLPFLNADGDPATSQFAEGLTEELIETLSEVEGLRVASQTSAFQFRGKQDDLRAVARKLNVGVVLEGSIRRSGKNLRITARLVNAAEGYQYYSHTYEHEINDTPAFQREIAAQVASVLRIGERGQEVARFTHSAEAHRWYMQGLYHASRMSESEMMQAIDCYQWAINYDAAYSPVFASLADAYITLALWNEGPRDAMKLAGEAARSAVRTGGSFAHSHAALGSYLALHDWDWAGAESEFRRAIDADPNDSPIRQQYAMRYLVPQGDLESALFELQRAQRVDPLSPEVALDRGRVRYFKRDPQRALSDFRAAAELDQNMEIAPLALAEALIQKESLHDATTVLEEPSAPTEDEARLAVLGTVYALSHQPERARQVLQQLGELDRHYRHISGYYFAQVYLALGEPAQALGWLESAVEEHSPLVAYAKVAPQFESLRGEPRFHAILRKIGLEK